MGKWIVLTAAVLGWATVAAAAEPLGVGDPAPRLAVKEFVKGDAVKELQKGKTYVVAFWATWHQGSRLSLATLSELQRKHKDVVVIGVSVLEQDASKVKPFVEEMGNKVDFRVALDDVPEGAQSSEGKIVRTWKDAAGQEALPVVFIINGAGKVAWIGQPREMARPLREIAAGRWDIAAAAREVKAWKVLQEKLAGARLTGDLKEMLSLMEQAITDEPGLEYRAGIGKFRVLAGLGDDADKTLAYAKCLTEKVYADDAERLNEVAWTIVNPMARREPDAKLVRLALSAARRADELAQSKDAAIADTLARAYFDSGDVNKALEHQERAMRLATGTALVKDPGLRSRLQEYRKAAGKE
jgi:hypothetical protein